MEEIGEMFFQVFYVNVVKIMDDVDVGSSKTKRGDVSGELYGKWKGKDWISMIKLGWHMRNTKINYIKGEGEISQSIINNISATSKRETSRIFALKELSNPIQDDQIICFT